MSTDRAPTGLPQSQQGVAARAAGLIAVAEDLAGEFSLRPLLERILRRCTELLGCHAGSICSVDEAAGTYRKEADIGVACQSGRVFPLTEGMTGAVVAHRAPVWFARYDEVPGGQAILSGLVLQQLHRGLQEDETGPVLTDRERQVRSMMEQGLPDKLIAEQLVLSVKTVEKHAGAVLRKTGARNRTELAALASRAPTQGGR